MRYTYISECVDRANNTIALKWNYFLCFLWFIYISICIYIKLVKWTTAISCIGKHKDVREARIMVNRFVRFDNRCGVRHCSFSFFTHFYTWPLSGTRAYDVRIFLYGLRTTEVLGATTPGTWATWCGCMAACIPAKCDCAAAAAP